MSVHELRALLARDGLDAVARPRGLKVRRHGVHPNLVQLKYDQLASPMADPVVRVCRGVVLDENDDWAVVSYPFDKFFNHGESHAAEIDWSTARVYEKLDGTLCTLYPYAGRWHVATTGTPDGSGRRTTRAGTPATFAELFWRAWESCGLDQLYPPPHCCLMFELTTPENVVVVPHDDYRLTCIGARRLDPDAGYPEMDSGDLGALPTARTFPLTTLADTLAAARALSGREQEGFVVRDAAFRRVKVKSPGYLALHRISSRFQDSTRPILELVLLDQADDAEALWPEYRGEIRALRARVGDLLASGNDLYARARRAPTAKDFALAVRHHPLAGGMFRVRAGRAPDLGVWLREQDVRKVERWIGGGRNHA